MKKTFRQKVVKIFFLVILYTLYFILNTATVNASTFSLGVFPPIIEIIARPDSEVKAKIKVFNYGDSTSLRVYPTLFRAADEFGNIEPLTNKSEDIKKSKEEVLSWLKIEAGNLILPGEINIDKDKSQVITLIFKIPKRAPENDHYLTIFFESLPFSKIKETHAKTQARIGANILLTVSDRAIIPKYGEIVEFSCPKFVESGPVHFTLRVKNKGRTFFKPYGSIKVYNTLMKETGEIAILPQNILAGTTRALQDKSILAQMKEQKVLGVKKEAGDWKSQVGKFFKKIFLLPQLSDHPVIRSSNYPSLVFPQTFLIGKYTAVASFTLDEKGPTLTAKTTFYAFPVRIALAVVVVIFLLPLIKKRLKG